MRLTTKGRYAVTALLDLAIHADQGPVNLADISRRQGISLSYLEQLFAKLRRSELVCSIRGPGGGYRLGRKPQNIRIAQIIDAVNESVDATKCQGKGNCQQGETVSALPISSSAVRSSALRSSRTSATKC